MSGYPPNGNDDRYLNQQYVNFDQFLVQHNIGSSPQAFYTPNQNGYYQEPNHPISSSPAQTNSHRMARRQQQQQQQPSSFAPFPPPPHRAMQQFLVQNSNLIPTAKEFIPNANSPSTSTDNVSNFTNCVNSTNDSLPPNENIINDRHSNRRYRTNKNDMNRGANLIDKTRNFDNRSNHNRRKDRGNFWLFTFLLFFNYFI